MKNSQKTGPIRSVNHSDAFIHHYRDPSYPYKKYYYYDIYYTNPIFVNIQLDSSDKEFGYNLELGKEAYLRFCYDQDIYLGYPFDEAPSPPNIFSVFTNDINNGRINIVNYEVYGIDYKNRYTINKLCKHPDIMMEYVETKDISDESLKHVDDDAELLTDLDALHSNNNDIRSKISQYYLTNPSKILPDTQIVNQQYDDILKELPVSYKWKLLYRASEHDYTVSSFHEYCDNQASTLVIIKSSGGWIFGGYTTRLWNGKDIYDDTEYNPTLQKRDDDNAFIFTLKNPHEVKPTQNKKEILSCGYIQCYTNYGPVFGDKCISINDHCNRRVNLMDYDSVLGCKCEPQHINTALFDEKGHFSVLDYEVYGIDFEDRENINKLCKHPDIMMEYVETQDISEESLKQFDDDAELLTDLDALCCEDSAIRLKISQYCFKNPSKILPETQIVNQQYDGKLRKWLGSNSQWKLIYRASEHDYSAQTFHDCCDYLKSNLVIIKSSGGWIFGGYTTRLWNGRGIYDDTIFYSIGKFKDNDIEFIFTLKNPYGVEPTRYMKKEDAKKAAECDPSSGPIFGNNTICIKDHCDKFANYIHEDPSYVIECQSQYKASLFVDTALPKQTDIFSVLDYEVYTCV